jgi:hypothetical protein
MKLIMNYERENELKGASVGFFRLDHRINEGKL